MTMTPEEKLDLINERVEKVKNLYDALGRMAPILDGSSGTYLGIYEQAAKDVCEAMGWEYKGTQPVQSEESEEMTAEDKASRIKKFEDFMNDPERIKRCREAEEQRKAEIANHPDNGKFGWWHVWGLRHTALVRGSSAIEVIKKAEDAGEVQDWEMPTARYMGDDLPDVVSL